MRVAVVSAAVAPLRENRAHSIVNNFAGFSVEGANQTRQLLRHVYMLAQLLVPPVFAVNIIEVFERCGTVDKVIVLGLLIFSLVAWTVMFGKHFELKRLRLLNHSFESQLRDHRTVLDSPEKAAMVLRHTGCDAVMIGRAAQGRPWIFREVSHYLATGEHLAFPLPRSRYGWTRPFKECNLC